MSSGLCSQSDRFPGLPSGPIEFPGVRGHVFLLVSIATRIETDNPAWLDRLTWSR